MAGAGRGNGEERSRLVYSTDGGRVKPQPHNRRLFTPPPATPKGSPPDDGVVRIHRDRRGRGGKAATAITGLPGSDAELDRLLKELKASLGTGGSRDGRTLFIQGDQRERLLEALTAKGHRAKIAGG